MANILLDLMEYDWTNDVLEDLEFSLQRAKEVFPEVSGFLPDTQKLLEWLRWNWCTCAGFFCVLTVEFSKQEGRK